MGQAKQRGTYEERKAIASERIAAMRDKAREVFLQSEANMSPLNKARFYFQRLRVARRLGLQLDPPSDADPGDQQP